MGNWTFITNHGLVLAYIARSPQSTAREIALAIGVTERTVHKIIADLTTEGYLERQRRGRRNEYRVNLSLPLRHPLQRGVTVASFLRTLASSDSP